MQPGERIPLIRRLAERLAAEKDWAEIDFVLDQFGAPTEYSWQGTMYEYVRHCLRGCPDLLLLSIEQYTMGQVSPAEEPWEEGCFRLFISHLATQNLVAHDLKSHLSFYGIDAFLAHEDIKPGKHWQRVIEAALHSCDALVALLHDGFRDSLWCDQEVGIALGRGVPVVPINYDLNPYGFFGSLQALNARGQLMKPLASSLMNLLLEDKRTAERLAEGIVSRLENARSYEEANRLSAVLNTDAPLISRDQAKRLRQAEKRNDQLQGAFDFDDNLSSIEAKIAVADPLLAPDEEPF